MAEKFEEAIKLVCKDMMRRGLAFIEYRPVQQTVIRGKPVWTKKSPFDFDGCLLGGKHISFEVKHVNDERLDIGKSAALLLHQLIALQDIERLGGVSFLLWKKGDVILRIRPSSIAMFYPRQKSIRWSDMLKTEKIVNVKDFLDDFLRQFSCQKSSEDTQNSKNILSQENFLLDK